MYDELRKRHYIFGGNPGGRTAKEARTRLGDFWRLDLVRPDREEVFNLFNVFVKMWETACFCL